MGELEGDKHSSAKDIAFSLLKAVQSRMDYKRMARLAIRLAINITKKAMNCPLTHPDVGDADWGGFPT